jgi:predicted DNA-binding antitoxin AbrB/MazE fold protein
MAFVFRPLQRVVLSSGRSKGVPPPGKDKSAEKLTGLGKVLQNIRMSRLNEDEDD